MAKASIAKGMYDQGLQFAREAQRLSGNSFAAVHLIKAYALMPMRLYKAAATSCRRSYRINPTVPTRSRRRCF